MESVSREGFKGKQIDAPRVRHANATPQAPLPQDSTGNATGSGRKTRSVTIRLDLGRWETAVALGDGNQTRGIERALDAAKAAQTAATTAWARTEATRAPTDNAPELDPQARAQAAALTLEVWWRTRVGPKPHGQGFRADRERYEWQQNRSERAGDLAAITSILTDKFDDDTAALAPHVLHILETRRLGDTP